ncbi:MAG TPA: hypothetical protein VGM56_23225 [Byssovorax sp.]|jgi:hypothetical protein
MIALLVVAAAVAVAPACLFPDYQTTLVPCDEGTYCAPQPEGWTGPVWFQPGGGVCPTGLNPDDGGLWYEGADAAVAAVCTCPCDPTATACSNGRVDFFDVSEDDCDAAQPCASLVVDSVVGCVTTDPGTRGHCGGGTWNFRPTVVPDEETGCDFGAVETVKPPFAGEQYTLCLGAPGEENWDCDPGTACVPTSLLCYYREGSHDCAEVSANASAHFVQRATDDRDCDTSCRCHVDCPGMIYVKQRTPMGEGGGGGGGSGTCSNCAGPRRYGSGVCGRVEATPSRDDHSFTPCLEATCAGTADAGDGGIHLDAGFTMCCVTPQ